jgi:hypothetical protein
MDLLPVSLKYHSQAKAISMASAQGSAKKDDFLCPGNTCT